MTLLRGSVVSKATVCTWPESHWSFRKETKSQEVSPVLTERQPGSTLTGPEMKGNSLTRFQSGLWWSRHYSISPPGGGGAAAVSITIISIPPLKRGPHLSLVLPDPHRLASPFRVLFPLKNPSSPLLNNRQLAMTTVKAITETVNKCLLNWLEETNKPPQQKRVAFYKLKACFWTADCKGFPR